MAVVDLLFRQVPLPTTSPVDLLFGQLESLPDQVITIGGTLPGLTGVVQIASTQREVTITGELPGLIGTIGITRPKTVTIGGTLPGLTGSVEVDFDVAVDRPEVGQVSASHQIAVETITGIETTEQSPVGLQEGPQDRCQSAIHFETGIESINPGDLEPVRGQGVGLHSEALQLGNWAIRSTHAEMLRDRRTQIRTDHSEGVDVRWCISTSHQEMYRRRSSVHTSSQEAIKRILSHRGRHTTANALRVPHRSRHQEAMVPPPGVIVVIPPVDQCYTPNPHLLFEQLATSDTNLLFICENHPTPPDETVVVPIRSVYIVMNDVTLRRVEGSVYLPTLSLSLSIDVDSWTWGFNATLPGQALNDVRSMDGQPVELEASINGNLYRLLAENVSRSRQFADSRVSVSGRGKNAILASPYAPVLTFANDIERSAQQLMADVLQFNGIPLGWDVDWQLEDWLVPAGVFNAQGSYIDGLNAIVGAAGAYLQPHPVNQEFSALLRYPVAPWDWATEVTPDFELPSAVTTQEGIEWRKKPDYNRVYVSGQQQGVLGRVTREGTAGDLAAPMVTDPLITTAVAARQRGLSILADTGRQAMVSLRLPVLAETGIITPGKFVEYVDGSDVKLGIVRSTNVDCSLPEVWQSIQVETHES